MKQTSLDDIAAVLRRARRVLAICHVAPDGDAIGSLLGFGWAMAQLQIQPEATTASHDRSSAGARQVVLVSPDPEPIQFGFLPRTSAIVASAPEQPWDAVVTLDASDPPRLGKPFRPETYNGAPVINLDHHITNLNFGALNYVDTTAAATAQIVLDLVDALGVSVSAEMATCLLAGLVTDTLSFRTSNVTIRVMDAARRLMEAGADLADITERTLNHKPLSMMRLWGLALGDLHLDGAVLWAQLTQEMRTRIGAPESGDGGLVGYLINAPEAKVSAVFSETRDGKVEIGFRARPGHDVSELALSLGGGGHPQASGCTVAGPLAEVVEQVLKRLRALT